MSDGLKACLFMQNVELKQEIMTIGSVVPLETIFTNLQNNERRYWHKDGKDEVNELSASIGTGEVIYPAVHPRFKLSPNEVYFNLGSCFARTIEQVLIACNRNVCAHDFNLPADYLLANTQSVLSKFNPLSMLQEIARATGVAHYPEEGLIQVGPDRWIDPQASSVKSNSKSAMMEIRNEINRIYARLYSASVVIITLGLTETFVDRETGLALNNYLPSSIMRRQPERFGFFNATVQDAFNAYKSIIELIRGYVNPEMRFIITVSPIPLRMTFTQNDVLVANTYSKSVLRVAASMLYEQYSCVDYFPSFEMALQSPRHLVWQSDQRHIHGPFIKKITNYFLDNYEESSGND